MHYRYGTLVSALVLVGAAAFPADRPAAQAVNPSVEENASPEVLVVEGIIGREVRSNADENMGRIVNVLVDLSGQVRAAVIDFGGFLGVGSRKIAVEWNTLGFAPAGNAKARITLGLTRDQVKDAPEFKEGKPVVILGAADKTSAHSLALKQ
jgi:hypothetical protein